MDALLSIFTYHDASVRVAIDQDTGEPLWVAKDVCDVLGIQNSRDALKRLDDDQKGVVLTDTPGGKQDMSTVTESGLYELIFRSDKPEAKEFRKWVTSVVLPAIRKTGKYEIPADMQQELQVLREKATIYQKKLDIRDSMIVAQNARLQKQLVLLSNLSDRETKKQRKNRRRQHFADMAKQRQREAAAVIPSNTVRAISELHQRGVKWSDISEQTGVSWRDVENVIKTQEWQRRKHA